MCSRPEEAGNLDPGDLGLFAHRMIGACKCGTTHGSGVARERNDIEATYDYRDENGVLLFQVVRKSGKQFLQRRPDGADGWIWKTSDVRKVLYHLAEIIAADPERVVYVVEGEKDVDALRLHGHVATCNPGGAGKWSFVAKLARTVLEGRDVVIVADNDEPGLKHARDVAKRLEGAARSLRVVHPPAPYKDVSDLLGAGGALEDLTDHAPVPSLDAEPFDPIAEIDAGSKVVRLAALADPPLESWEVELRKRLILTTKARKKGGDSITIRACSANIATILQHHPAWAGVVALNTFHCRLEAVRVPPWYELDAPKDLKPGAWTDGDNARLAHWFARTWIARLPPLGVGAKTIEPALLVAAEANTCHPVRDYLRSLTWDGEPRIDGLAANYLGGSFDPYARAVGAAFMIGAVARVMRPGCKLDSCVVLEGGQGTLKSSAVEVLAGDWFADSKLPIGDKDAYQAIRGVWIYELGELAALSKADVETIKAFMSSRSDHYRPSYGKHSVDVPRQTVFAGTTNASQYLQDETGGRRFHPLRTSVIKLEALRKDRDQLWAEALHRFEGGERWWLEDALAAPEQSMRFVDDVWIDKIAGYLKGREDTSVADVLEELVFLEVEKDGVTVKNSIGRWGHREQVRVARCLVRLGWTRRQIRKGSARVWRYVSASFSEPVTSVTSPEEDTGDTIPA